MNAAIIPFRLLILNNSQKEAQRLISMFKNAGRPCRAQHITSLEDFEKSLQEQVWDLLISQNDVRSPTPAQAIRCIRKYNQDLPLILMKEDQTDRTVIDGMKLGAVDVVQLDDDQHLLLVVTRELANRDQRKYARTSERRAKELERLNQQLLDSSKDGIAFIQDGTFIYANESFAEMCGDSKRDDIEYAPIMDMVHSEDRDLIKKALKEVALQKQKVTSDKLKVRIKTGKGHYKHLEIELKVGQFEEESCVKLFVSKTFEKNNPLETGVEEIKLIDPATGVQNKLSFNQYLSMRVSEAISEGHIYSLIYLDLDKFKTDIESTIGLDGSEEILAAIAKLLEQNSQADDFIARVGDDSFAIVGSENSLSKLIDVSNNICSAIRDHFFDVKSKTIRLTASIGITLINDTTIDAQFAINQATQAIDAIRSKGQSKQGDGVNIYQAEKSEQTVMASALQQAIKENRFRLLFQPIISLRGDSVERYEVFLRMIDDDGKEISPEKFLNTAKSIQAIGKIDRWVLLEAIKQLSKRDQKAKHAQLQVHISHHSLCDESLLGWLKVAFQAAKVDPKSLVLQSSESTINDYLSVAKKFIEEATSMGISFCINNFGCALDQMALLDHVDVAQVKIDGSFSIEIQENSENIEAMGKLLNALNEKQKIIIVPMVEKASILATLWKMNVQCIQGNYIRALGPNMDYEFSVEEESA
ncbi:MAG: diguanylate cyclase (GGDEF)-like protein/PAS domain S-box-containing protein [Cellvibrionaceae bacterium]|jgi:diguanylate cyclase (GGDEF)-like protein/PAS domain S-box-containing protein